MAFSMYSFLVEQLSFWYRSSTSSQALSVSQTVCRFFSPFIFQNSSFLKTASPHPGQTAVFRGFFPISASRLPLEQGKSVSPDPPKPPALWEVVPALTHNSVRAFSCSSSSQAPYPSFPPKRAKTRSFRCASSPQRTRCAGLRRGPHFLSAAAQIRPENPGGAGPCPAPKEGTQPLTGRYAGRFSLCRRVPSCGRNIRQHSSILGTTPKRVISPHSRIRNTTLS